MTTHRNLKPHYAEPKGKSGPVIRIPAPLSESDDMQTETFREPVEPRKCSIHRWTNYIVDVDGVRLTVVRCSRPWCNKVRDEAAAKRGATANKYGKRAELKAARKYGGSKIGAAGGPVDIRGKDFATQMKTHRRAVPAEWRKVFAAMGQENRCRRLLLRFVQGPGVAPADFFVFQADDFLDWFGRDEGDAA